MRPDTRSSTKELHASHQQRQTQARATASRWRRARPAARLPRAGGLRRLLESSSTTTNASGHHPTGTGATGTRRQGAARGSLQALRECLQKNGITLPKRTPGQRPPGGPGGFLGGGAGGPQLPKRRDARAVRSRREEVRRRRRSRAAAGRASGARPSSRRSPKFAACMRENGVNVPATEHLRQRPDLQHQRHSTRASPQFRAAEAKCRGDLSGAFRRGPGPAEPPTAARALRLSAWRRRRPPRYPGRCASGGRPG